MKKIVDVWHGGFPIEGDEIQEPGQMDFGQKPLIDSIDFKNVNTLQNRVIRNLAIGYSLPAFQNTGQLRVFPAQAAKIGSIAKLLQGYMFCYDFATGAPITVQGVARVWQGALGVGVTSGNPSGGFTVSGAGNVIYPQVAIINTQSPFLSAGDVFLNLDFFDVEFYIGTANIAAAQITIQMNLQIEFS